MHVAGAEEVAAGQGLELDVEQARRVVGALEEGADAQEVQRLVHQHRADGDAAALVRAELDPFEEVARVAFEGAVRAAGG